ncbi:hypothetical protein JL722_1123 [Aureococcus anophagefferens]|nr:hypothetical protein JL722_1123 [Aureococcus anophagefferens]
MKAVRAAVGVEDFAVIFRVSMLELVENGLSFDESVELSAALHAAGVDIINTGIGWHEARVPTIATCVPRAPSRGRRGARRPRRFVGGGGIGFGVSEFLTHDAHHEPESEGELDAFCAEWGIDRSGARSNGSGLAPKTAAPPARRCTSSSAKSALGAGLGKTTGWIHRAALRQRGVEFVKGCEYVSVEDDGFHVKVDGERGVLGVTASSCAGQVAVNDLYDETDVDAFLIGGAQKAGELDAKRAIDQGYRLAGAIETAEPGAVLEMPVGWRASAPDGRDAMGRNSA